ncbi:type II toxin-antitoxin system Phd/YefM family antitoxin [Mesorhizobium sp. J428]|uniref:type II toxin-antitoxin system Phd/YefM family antitoxin n=1 Tax=Mesorhizobium sp. J428 TaxID=2898440 RepID=UPI002151401B|nr:type II toxin-antitoxin system prevent-host-death family antitoxin [Mesorhizobium sp. J428]MCR5858722.1 type II toxin-antitoxin system prevent-host-death family antitoxin [Mesorhizobium sp. J428]
MLKVNILEAKNSLSRLIEAVESGAEPEIIIARNGKPAARLVAIQTRPTGKRPLGMFRDGTPPLDLETFNATDPIIEKLFAGEASAEP